MDGGTIIVGADGEDGAGTDRGAAYIFSKDLGGADNWGQVAKIVSAIPLTSTNSAIPSPSTVISLLSAPPARTGPGPTGARPMCSAAISAGPTLGAR